MSILFNWISKFPNKPNFEPILFINRRFLCTQSISMTFCVFTDHPLFVYKFHLSLKVLVTHFTRISFIRLLTYIFPVTHINSISHFYANIKHVFSMILNDRYWNLYASGLRENQFSISGASETFLQHNPWKITISKPFWRICMTVTKCIITILLFWEKLGTF